MVLTSRKGDQSREEGKKNSEELGLAMKHQEGTV